MKKLLTVLLCLGLAGCATADTINSYYQKLTSGNIGCPTSDIQITNIVSSGRVISGYPNAPLTYTAVCGEQKYYCSQRDINGDIVCSKAKQ